MIYVGIDVASEKHDFFIISDLGVIYTKHSITIDNNEDGYKKLHKSIKEFCGECNDSKVRIGLESTGFYHRNITYFLLQKEYDVMIINPALINLYKKSRKVHTAKNDNIDSIAICKYLQDNEDSFKPYTAISYHTEALKALSRDRFSLVEELRLAKINIYKLLTQLFPEYLKLFSNIYRGSALDIITKYPSPYKLSKAHEKTISSMIHGKCQTTAKELIQAAKTSIGKNTWIGDNVIILSGVKIGDNCVIGAGSIVTKDVESNSIYAGNPAHLIKRLDDGEKIEI